MQGTPGFPQTRSRTGTGPGPDRTRDTAHEYIHLFHIFWFLLDRFWLPKIEKVIKFGWFKPFQFDSSDLLVWWLWFLLDRFRLPKIEKKVIKFCWFNSFQFDNSNLLVWWLWLLSDRFWLPNIEKVINSSWFNSFQFDNSNLLVWWLWFLFDGFWLPKIEKVIKSAWFNSFQFLYFWSSGLVTLITFGRVLAAKDWKSNQIWLIQFISISIILIFWFGDFDSFLTGFGCQSLKK